MEEIFRSYYKELVYYAFKFVKDKQIAEDIVMETFIAIYDKGYYNIRHLLYVAIKRNCLNYLKHNDRRLENITEEEIEDVVPEIIEADLLKALSDAMQKLPPNSKQVIEMYYYQGKRQVQIAKELNKPVGTIRNIKKYALSRLYKLLNKKLSI